MILYTLPGKTYQFLQEKRVKRAIASLKVILYSYLILKKMKERITDS